MRRVTWVLKWLPLGIASWLVLRESQGMPTASSKACSRVPSAGKPLQAPSRQSGSNACVCLWLFPQAGQS